MMFVISIIILQLRLPQCPYTDGNSDLRKFYHAERRLCPRPVEKMAARVALPAWIAARRQPCCIGMVR